MTSATRSSDQTQQIPAQQDAVFTNKQNKTRISFKKYHPKQSKNSPPSKPIQAQPILKPQDAKIVQTAKMVFPPSTELGPSMRFLDGPFVPFCRYLWTMPVLLEAEGIPAKVINLATFTYRLQLALIRCGIPSFRPKIVGSGFTGIFKELEKPAPSSPQDLVMRLNDLDLKLFIPPTCYADFDLVMSAFLQVLYEYPCSALQSPLPAACSKYIHEKCLINHENAQEDNWAMYTIGPLPYRQQPKTVDGVHRLRIEISIIAEMLRPYVHDQDSFFVEPVDIAAERVLCGTFSETPFDACVSDLLDNRLSATRPEEIQRGLFKFISQTVEGAKTTQSDLKLIYLQKTQTEFSSLKDLGDRWERYLNSHCLHLPVKRNFCLLNHLFSVLSLTAPYSLDRAAVHLLPAINERPLLRALFLIEQEPIDHTALVLTLQQTWTEDYLSNLASQLLSRIQETACLPPILKHLVDCLKKFPQEATLILSLFHLLLLGLASHKFDRSSLGKANMQKKGAEIELTLEENGRIFSLFLDAIIAIPFELICQRLSLYAHPIPKELFREFLPYLTKKTDEKQFLQELIAFALWKTPSLAPLVSHFFPTYPLSSKPQHAPLKTDPLLLQIDQALTQNWKTSTYKALGSLCTSAIKNEERLDALFILFSCEPTLFFKTAILNEKECNLEQEIARLYQTLVTHLKIHEHAGGVRLLFVLKALCPQLPLPDKTLNLILKDQHSSAPFLSLAQALELLATEVKSSVKFQNPPSSLKPEFPILQLLSSSSQQIALSWSRQIFWSLFEQKALSCENSVYWETAALSQLKEHLQQFSIAHQLLNLLLKMGSHSSKVKAQALSLELMQQAAFTKSLSLDTLTELWELLPEETNSSLFRTVFEIFENAGDLKNLQLLLQSSQYALLISSSPGLELWAETQYLSLLFQKSSLSTALETCVSLFDKKSISSSPALWDALLLRALRKSLTLPEGYPFFAKLYRRAIALGLEKRSSSLKKIFDKATNLLFNGSLENRLDAAKLIKIHCEAIPLSAMQTRQIILCLQWLIKTKPDQLNKTGTTQELLHDLLSILTEDVIFFQHLDIEQFLSLSYTFDELITLRFPFSKNLSHLAIETAIHLLSRFSKEATNHARRFMHSLEKAKFATLWPKLHEQFYLQLLYSFILSDQGQEACSLFNKAPLAKSTATLPAEWKISILDHLFSLAEKKPTSTSEEMQKCLMLLLEKKLLDFSDASIQSALLSFCLQNFKANPSRNWEIVLQALKHYLPLESVGAHTLLTLLAVEIHKGHSLSEPLIRSFISIIESLAAIFHEKWILQYDTTPSYFSIVHTQIIEALLHLPEHRGVPAAWLVWTECHPNNPNTLLRLLQEVKYLAMPGELEGIILEHPFKLFLNIFIEDPEMLKGKERAIVNCFSAFYEYMKHHPFNAILPVLESFHRNKLMEGLSDNKVSAGLAVGALHLLAKLASDIRICLDMPDEIDPFDYWKRIEPLIDFYKSAAETLTPSEDKLRNNKEITVSLIQIHLSKNTLDAWKAAYQLMIKSELNKIWVPFPEDRARIYTQLIKRLIESKQETESTTKIFLSALTRHAFDNYPIYLRQTLLYLYPFLLERRDFRNAFNVLAESRHVLSASQETSYYFSFFSAPYFKTSLDQIRAAWNYFAKVSRRLFVLDKEMHFQIIKHLLCTTFNLPLPETISDKETQLEYIGNCFDSLSEISEAMVSPNEVLELCKKGFELFQEHNYVSIALNVFFSSLLSNEVFMNCCFETRKLEISQLAYQCIFAQADNAGPIYQEGIAMQFERWVLLELFNDRERSEIGSLILRRMANKAYPLTYGKALEYLKAWIPLCFRGFNQKLDEVIYVLSFVTKELDIRVNSITYSKMYINTIRSIHKAYPAIVTKPDRFLYEAQLASQLLTMPHPVLNAYSGYLMNERCNKKFYTEGRIDKLLDSRFKHYISLLPNESELMPISNLFMILQNFLPEATQNPPENSLE